MTQYVSLYKSRVMKLVSKMSLVRWQLSIVSTLSELIVLGRRRLCWEELVKCVV